jgi:hypothetical protein
MIDPFPQDWQLIGFFGCEPTLLDPGIPWVYNRVTFQTERNGELVVCEIEPASEIMDITWSQSGKVRLELKLSWVRSLAVVESAATEALVAEFRYGGQYLLPLRLQLRPSVMVTWGTSAQP